MRKYFKGTLFKHFYRSWGSSATLDTNRYVDRILQRVHWMLVGVVMTLLAAIIFLSVRLYQLHTLENVYMVAPDQTLVARRADETLSRSEYEIIAFTRLFLEKAFANNRYSLEENIKEVAEWMDKKSAYTLLSEMTDERIEALYKEGNAISTVSLEDIVVEKARNPHLVVVKYKHFLHFLSTGQSVYEDEELDGEVYFEIQLMKRSFKNPYGLQIRNLKFLPQAT